MNSKRRIAVLTGGGDVPGLNVAIKAIVGRAQRDNIEVIGVRRGWIGLLQLNPDDPASLDKWTMPLTHERVRTIDRTGGTILHTSRTNPSNVKPEEVPDYVRAEDRAASPKGTLDCTRHVLRVLAHLGVEALIPIGGDDTLSYASRLHQEGFQIVAIPKTMDNDVFGTDYCIGFSTAVTRSVEAITAFRTSAGSHERIDVDRAVISEVPFDIDRLIGFLKEDRAQNPSNYAIMTISEGARPVGGDILESGEVDAYGHKKLGGIGHSVAQEIKRRSGVNTMFEQLAYIMRSGAPDSLDRMVAISYGYLALDQVAMGHTGRMVALQQGIYTTVSLDLVSAGKKKVDV
ncbi:MAG: pyrophosphate-dependent phosphofructokinase, partial [Anaerolineales bacterium]|nr:pyrophosphate-dependent phosphofructokinase [Anaerolineales bacterium]